MKMFCKSLALLFVLGTVAFAWDCPLGQHLVQTDGGKFVVAGKHFSCEKDGNEIKNINKNKNDNTNINKSTASASAGASASGGDASNSNNTTNIAEASKIPVSTAYAPTALPTVPCFKGYGGGAQTSGFGFSLGGGKVDEGCNAREDARSYMLMGSRTAACKIMITQKASKKAHITMEDCMASDVSNGTEVDSMVPAVIGSNGVENMTILDNGASHNQIPGISEAFTTPIDGTLSNLSTSPMPTQNAIGIIGKDTSRDRVIGVCTFASSQTKCQAVQTSPKHVTDICDVMLEEARRALHEDSTALLKLEGNRNKQEDVVLDIERTMATRVKLVNMGVDPNRIIMTYGNSGERTVVITLIHSNPWN